MRGTLGSSIVIAMNSDRETTMRTMRLTALIVALTVSLAVGASTAASSANDPDGARGRYGLPEDEKRPEKFEPFLREHPEDETRREAALVWYSRRESNTDKLRYHTLEMVKHHPANMDIFWANASAFFAKPDYRLEVIRNLEDQVAAGHTQHEVYLNLAITCEQGAIPPVAENPESRSRFLRYYGLPEDTQLPTEVDRLLAGKAVQYFEFALSTSEADDFYAAFYSEQLADLLMRLGEPEKAAVICEKALPHVTDMTRAHFLVTYGRCLRESGNTARAKEILAQVRGCDKDGFNKGPGSATASAETALGLIAMEEGDIETAKKYLLSSCNVQRDCGNITGGLSLELARKLFDAGERDVVAEYCQQVLSKFTPDQEETKNLLHRALEQNGKATP